MSEAALFDGFEPAPNPDQCLSADRRRTINQRRNVESGRHPLTGGKTYPQMGTCGDCRFRQLVEWHTRSYPKCVNEHSPTPTHGTGSDVRAWWPACVNHEFGDPKVSADAMRSGPALVGDGQPKEQQ